MLRDLELLNAADALASKDAPNMQLHRKAFFLLSAAVAAAAPTAAVACSAVITLLLLDCDAD